MRGSMRRTMRGCARSWNTLRTPSRGSRSCVYEEKTYRSRFAAGGDQQGLSAGDAESAWASIEAAVGVGRAARGREPYAYELNAVAMLINRAMIEIPPKFAGKPPVNPESQKRIGSQTGWKGAQGLAEDVRYYGKWMRDEAEKRIGDLYPKVE